MRGKRVLVLGLGRHGGGIGTALWAVRGGAEVVVTDLASESDLRPALAELEGLPIRYRLGGHDPADLDWADVVIRSPAVPNHAPILAQARERGVPVTTEMAIFFESARGQTIGVTGSKGKTTTSSIVHHIVSDSYAWAKALGNMGVSAVQHADMPANGVATIEISSFQAEGLTEQGLAPSVLVVTNLLEDHLDRYDNDIELYHEAKARLLDGQGPDGWAILPSSPYERGRLGPRVKGRRAYFQVRDHPLPDGADGVWRSGEVLRSRWAEREFELLPVEELPLGADHYVSNVAAATCAALAAGVSPGRVSARLRTLELVPHRQEPVAVVDGVSYINDTTATIPAAAAASISSYPSGYIYLIAGGADKALDTTPLVEAIAQHVAGVSFLKGTATAAMIDRLRRHGYGAISGPHSSMAAAVSDARARAAIGDTVLLAPGAASFGLFSNEFDRGEKFRQAVHDLDVRNDAA